MLLKLSRFFFILNSYLSQSSGCPEGKLCVTGYTDLTCSGSSAAGSPVVYSPVQNGECFSFASFCQYIYMNTDDCLAVIKLLGYTPPPKTSIGTSYGSVKQSCSKSGGSIVVYSDSTCSKAVKSNPVNLEKCSTIANAIALKMTCGCNSDTNICSDATNNNPALSAMAASLLLLL